MSHYCQYYLNNYLDYWVQHWHPDQWSYDNGGGGVGQNDQLVNWPHSFVLLLLLNFTIPVVVEQLGYNGY